MKGTHKHKKASLIQHHLYCVFTYIYSLLIEKDICDCQNVSVKLPCVYVCLSSGDLFIFSVRVSSCFSYFFVIRTSVLFLSMWFIFSVRVSSCFSYFFCYPYFGTFPFYVVHFFSKSFLLLFLFFCYPYFGTFPFYVVSMRALLCFKQHGKGSSKVQRLRK